jgi:hypothetical protein
VIYGRGASLLPQRRHSGEATCCLENIYSDVSLDIILHQYFLYITVAADISMAQSAQCSSLGIRAIVHYIPENERAYIMSLSNLDRMSFGGMFLNSGMRPVSS